MSEKRLAAFAKMRRLCFDKAVTLHSQFDEVWSIDKVTLLQPFAGQLREIKEERSEWHST